MHFAQTKRYSKPRGDDDNAVHLDLKPLLGGQQQAYHNIQQPIGCLMTIFWAEHNLSKIQQSSNSTDWLTNEILMSLIVRWICMIVCFLYLYISTFMNRNIAISTIIVKYVGQKQKLSYHSQVAN